jgi:Pyruvate/2-oxoacid:ferredoxin oxidoreductase delta subunit
MSSKYESVKATLELQKRVIDYHVWHTCTNCYFWSRNHALRDKAYTEASQYSYCEKYGTVPPADVIVVGCEVWDYDIPF